MSTLSIDALLDMDATSIARVIMDKRMFIYEIVSAYITHEKNNNAYIPLLKIVLMKL